MLLGSGANFLKCMFLSGEKALQILSGQDHGPNFRGSGANFLKCMFLSGEKALQILSGQDHGPHFRSGGCFSG